MHALLGIYEHLLLNLYLFFVYENISFMGIKMFFSNFLPVICKKKKQGPLGWGCAKNDVIPLIIII